MANPTKKVQTNNAPAVTETNEKKSRAVVVPAQCTAMVSGFAADMSTSAKIRALDNAGYGRSVIAKALDIRYQHVRNVLITPLKRAAAE